MLILAAGGMIPYLSSVGGGRHSPILGLVLKNIFLTPTLNELCFQKPDHMNVRKDEFDRYEN